MNIQSLSALLAAIVTAAIGVSVLLRDRRQQSYQRFTGLCVTLFSWHILTFLSATLESDVLYQLSLVPAMVIPISSMRFFRPFLSDPRTVKPGAPVTPRWMALLAGGFIAAIGWSVLFRKGLPHRLPFAVAMGAFVFGGLYASMVIVYRRYRRTLQRVEKTRLVYLLWGGVLAISAAASEYLPNAGVPFPSMGNVVTIIYMYFISQTLLRYRLLDLNELLGRMAVLATLVMILAAIYGMLVAWVPTSQSGVFLFNTLVASFVVIILFEPLRTLVEGQIQKWLFREMYELKARIDALRALLTNVIDLREAVRVTIVSMEESHRVTHSALYLVDGEGAGLRPARPSRAQAGRAHRRRGAPPVLRAAAADRAFPSPSSSSSASTPAAPPCPTATPRPSTPSPARSTR